MIAPVIYLDIKPDLVGISRCETNSEGFHIKIRSDIMSAPGPAQEKVLAFVCHELGHALGLIVGTDAAKNDPRSSNRYAMSQAIMTSEQEAWRIGMEIFANIEKYALQTYYKLLDNSPKGC